MTLELCLLPEPNNDAVLMTICPLGRLCLIGVEVSVSLLERVDGLRGKFFLAVEKNLCNHQTQVSLRRDMVRRKKMTKVPWCMMTRILHKLQLILSASFSSLEEVEEWRGRANCSTMTLSSIFNFLFLLSRHVLPSKKLIKLHLSVTALIVSFSTRLMCSPEFCSFRCFVELSGVHCWCQRRRWKGPKNAKNGTKESLWWIVWWRQLTQRFFLNLNFLTNLLSCFDDFFQSFTYFPREYFW